MGQLRRQLTPERIEQIRKWPAWRRLRWIVQKERKLSLKQAGLSMGGVSDACVCRWITLVRKKRRTPEADNRTMLRSWTEQSIVGPILEADWSKAPAATWSSPPQQVTPLAPAIPSNDIAEATKAAA